MEIICHRGFWTSDSEKNTLSAFRRSFSYGYGVEVDIRDLNSELVISHDLPLTDCLTVRQLLELYLDFEVEPIIAFNIKADGLVAKLESLICAFGLQNYFVFDMSVPDMRHYLKRNVNFYTRMSEFELIPSFFDSAQGVWLDGFEGHWVSEALIKQFSKLGKRICIVSPELHGRPFMDEWQIYRTWSKDHDLELSICTDFPCEADEYFNDTN